MWHDSAVGVAVSSHVTETKRSHIFVTVNRLQVGVSQYGTPSVL